MSKYKAIREGRHASRKEARRAAELALLQKIGAISDLEEQVKYELIPKQEGERAVHYIADFQYLENGQLVTEDSKGFRTRDYVLKRKLMLLKYGIKIRET